MTNQLPDVSETSSEDYVTLCDGCGNEKSVALECCGGVFCDDCACTHNDSHKEDRS